MIEIRRHLKLFLVLLVVVFFKCSLSITSPELKIECRKILHFKQKVDHFNLLSDSDEYFNHRFIFSNRSRQGSENPIIFFISSTSDLISTCEHNVFAWEISEKVGGLMVFAEHRYFGTSRPGGNLSHTYPNYRYLMLDQVLEDFAHLIKHIRTEMYMHRRPSNNSEEEQEEEDEYEDSSENRSSRRGKESAEESSEEDEHEAPVITIGAGYGGMLATWMRTKHAHVVVGALASSAPLIQSNYGEFSQLVTKSYASVDQRCPRIIRRLWTDINTRVKGVTTSSADDFLAAISSIFGLCRTLSSLQQVNSFKEWLRLALSRLAMYNYQYSSNVLKPLPSYPVKSACLKIIQTFEALNATDEYRTLKAVAQGISIYTNHTNRVKCVDFDKEYISNLDRINMDILICSGIKLHFTSNGVDDMFEPTNGFNFEEYSARCQKVYNITPVHDSFSISFPSRLEEFYSYSNIIFSNGDLDPLHSSGIYSYVNDRINVIFIGNAAHQADLLRSTNNDSESLRRARSNEIKIIRKWIDEYDSEIFINNNAAQHFSRFFSNYLTSYFILITLPLIFSHI